tara:strand:- start:138 stop:1658 length:1521 start_codon:yes stop_codon:yes gene_type:complete
MNNQKYLVLKKYKYTKNNFYLTSIDSKYMEKIRNWRNDQIDILRQNKVINKKEQKNYFIKNIHKEKNVFRPKNILLCFFYKKILIGYGGIVHISWKNRCGEISFLLDTKIKENQKKFKTYFVNFKDILFDIAFKELKLNKLTTETFSHRNIFLEILNENGFKFEGYYKNQYNKNDKNIHSIKHSFYKRTISIDKKLNVLFSSSSNKLILIKSLENALSRLTNRFEIILGDSNLKSVSKNYGYKFWHMPKTEDKNISKILKYCIKNRVNIIFPTRDSELMFWSKNIKLFEKYNIKIVVSKLKYLDICLNKLKFYQYCKKNNIDSIETFENIKNIKHKYLVIKDKLGSGSKKIGIKINKNEIKKFMNYIKNPIFQKYENGKEITIDAYFNKKNTLVNFIMRERNLIIDGESKITSIYKNIKIRNKIKKILSKFKFFGHINLQAFVKKSSLKVIEINPRLGGSSVFSIIRGLDSFYWSLLECNNKKLKIKMIENKKIKKIIKYESFIIE